MNQHPYAANATPGRAPGTPPSRSAPSEPMENDPLILEGATAWGRTPQLRSATTHGQFYMQGTSADEAYFLVQGRVQLHRDGPLRRVVIDTLERGDWLGLGEMLLGRGYATTAVALEPCSVFVAPRETSERLFAAAPAVMVRALKSSQRQALRLSEALDAQTLDHTFLGFCRGLELILAPTPVLPESQLTARLRELFALPVASIREVLKLLESLNLVQRQQEPPKEAFIALSDPARFGERSRAFSEQWRGRLPSLMGEAPPREAYKLEELCEMLGTQPVQMLRRMTLPDFPMGILRFDPEGVELFRKMQGDSFFKKRVSDRELLGQLESVDELKEVDVALLRDILPKMEISRLVRLLAGLPEDLRAHLTQALSARLRRTVEEEVRHMPACGARDMADLEDELLRLCRGA